MRIGTILSARNKANRLPGKALLPYAGQPLTGFMLRRLSSVPGTEGVLLATSTDPRDTTLCDVATELGFQSFRGSPDDKLLRYRDAARAQGWDYLIVVDGDDPFVSVRHLGELAAFARSECPDLAVVEGLPLGATGFLVALTALEAICRDRPEADTEVWGHLFRRDPAYRCIDLNESDPRWHHPDWRLTLDYPEDYQLHQKIMHGLEARGLSADFENVMAFLADNMALLDINRHVQAAYEAGLARARAAALSPAAGGQS
ncbi:cytidylyltransferase domain-containing protein [Azospirillum soli]|uniref:cytidylyltransferase domain-containing protein n=1 Tax=Azospirillum soli TaxID=1304799 RepID=UPI001AE3F35D|nr:hypothetical protein [Azospirillum soli]MBP2316248.1 spore coat polysaccharide biosynthesis protein SpsF (cytidylyltransferase family) [Azospirillum soli]